MEDILAVLKKAMSEVFLKVTNQIILYLSSTAKLSEFI